MFWKEKNSLKNGEVRLREPLLNFEGAWGGGGGGSYF